MSSTNISFNKLVLKQAKWKCRAYSKSLINLIFFQLLFALGVGYSSMYGSGMNNINLNVNIYSIDVYLIIASIWAFVTAVLTQTTSCINQDYSMTTNRLSSNLANVIVLIIYSLIGTVVSIMSLYISGALKLIQKVDLITDSLIFSPLQFAVTFLIILLISSIGYFFGATFRLSKIFGIVLIATLVLIIYKAEGHLVGNVFIFYFGASYSLFLLKAFITIVVLFILSVVLVNKKEVVRR